MSQIPSRLHIGAAYYPEQWPEERWAEDIRLMRSAGFTVARLAEFAWSTMETANGLLAVARLRKKEYVLAKQAADAAAQQIGRSSHTVFTNVEGYSAVAETYLGLLEQCDDHKGGECKTLVSHTGQILKAIRIQARGVPAGLARYWLHRGSFRWLAGKRRRAFADWHKSLVEAERLQMPYDQGRACYEIGRHLPAGHIQR